MVHVPEILRHRADYSLAREGGGQEALADLLEAVAVATEQGASVARLRSALALASLPGDLRPPDWREVLNAARESLPGSYASTESDAADLLLRR
jgi:hypothetical protein